jgi:hypothetical protein
LHSLKETTPASIQMQRFSAGAKFNFSDMGPSIFCVVLTFLKAKAVPKREKKI